MEEEEDYGGCARSRRGWFFVDVWTLIDGGAIVRTNFRASRNASRDKTRRYSNDRRSTFLSRRPESLRFIIFGVFGARVNRLPPRGRASCPEATLEFDRPI